VNLERSIAETFAAARPTEAARVLEHLPEEAVRDLLEDSDVGAAVAVVAALTPLLASRCLSLTMPSRAAEILQRLPLDRATDLTRRLGPDERASVLSHVPDERRRPLEKLLRFPESTAGALMEPRVASFPESLSVEATLERARRPGSELRYYVYVVNDDLVLTGVTSLRELVSASPAATLRSIMTGPVQTLSARAGRKAILGHPGWLRYPVLPVVDEADRLVGVFRYETFRRLQDRPETEDASPLNVALALGELFWLGASGILRGLEEPSTPKESADG
jgi:magnesium transporter